MIFKTSKLNNYIRLSIAAFIIFLGLFVFQNPLLLILIVFFLSDRLRGATKYNLENDMIKIIKTKKDVLININELVEIIHYKNPMMANIPLPSEYAIKTNETSYTIKSNLYNDKGQNLIQVLKELYGLEVIEEIQK